MLWQIHHVSSAARLREKQLKAPHTGRAAPIVNEGASMCGPKDDRFIRKCQWRRHACGRQLNDLQYMRLWTQGTEKKKDKDNWYENQEYRTKFAQFSVIIKQLKPIGSKPKITDSKIEVTVVREATGGPGVTSVNKSKMWAKASPRSLACLPKVNSHTHKHNHTFICMQTDNTNTFLAFGQATDNLWSLMLLSCRCMKVDARNSQAVNQLPWITCSVINAACQWRLQCNQESAAYWITGHIVH